MPPPPKKNTTRPQPTHQQETLRAFRLTLIKAPKGDDKAIAFITDGYMGAEKVRARV